MVRFATPSLQYPEWKPVLGESLAFAEGETPDTGGIPKKDPPPPSGDQGAKPNGHDPEKGDQKVIPEDRVNQIVEERLARERRRSQETINQLEARLAEASEKAGKTSELEQAIASMREEFDELRPKDADDDDPLVSLLKTLDPPKWAKTKELQEIWKSNQLDRLRRDQHASDLQTALQKNDQTLSQLKERLDAAEQREQEARDQAVKADRASKIATVIAQLGEEIHDPELTEMWVNQLVEREKDTGRYTLRVINNDGDVERVPFTKENLSKHLKPSLRRSAIQASGSGAGGTQGGDVGTPSVDDLVAQVAAAKQRAESRPQDRQATAEYMTLRRQLAAVQKQKAS